MLNSFPPIDNTPPLPHELEISIFGPGVGECIVIHLGNGQWMIIDSCIDPTCNQPAAVKHLENIGVDLSSAVKLVLVSHWHDDHIRGLSVVVSQCESARVCYSAALLKQEFLSLVSIYSGRLSLVDRYTSGTREIANIIKVLEERINNNEKYRTNCMVPVLADRLLFENDEENYKCNVRTMSPSDKSFKKALISFSEMIPTTKNERVTLTSQKIQNHNAIAVWVNFNNIKMLLGSDLEETGDPQIGWSAIIDSPVRPNGKAGIFKIPHHGSPNGHHEKVWTEMVDNDSISLLTSFSRGATFRPQPGDIERIKQYTSKLFYTYEPRLKLPKRDPAVERTLRGMAIDRKALGGEIGHIQIRALKNDEFKINLKAPATKL